MTTYDYQLLKEKLRSRPHQLDSLEDWLLLVINTARAMIDNVNKSRLTDLKEFLDCETTAQVQLTYDHFQGKFGQADFSYRRHPNYIYLSSLVAYFPDYPLQAKHKVYIKKCMDIDCYFLYELI